MATVPGNSPRFQCIFCSFVGGDQSKLRIHFEREHARQNYFWCKWCGKLSECLDDFFEHLEKDLCEEIYQHPCGFDGCDYSESEPSRFIVHLKGVHRGKPLIPCKYCRRLFTIPPCLIIHLQSECCHRPSAEKAAISKAECIKQAKEEPAQSQPSSSQKKDNNSKTLPSKPNKKRKKGKEIDNPEHSASSESSSEPSSKPVKSSQPIKKKKEKEIPSKKRKFVDLFETHSDSDVDDPTWNPREDDDDFKDKPRRTGRTKKNSSTQKAKVEERLPKPERIIEKVSKCSEEPVFEMYKTWKDFQQKVDELKSKEALDELLKPENVVNFFKCMHSSCSYSTQTKMEFVIHMLSSEHEKPHRCCYCFDPFSYVEKITDHMLQKHSERRYQCSACLYRSSTKTQAKLHVKAAHKDDDSVEIVSCPKLEYNNPNSKSSSDLSVKRNRYKCMEPECEFTTLDTDVFLKHFVEKHPKIIYYPCSFCTYKTSNRAHFIKHFKKHNIFDFECFHCAFGADETDDVLAHMSINHPDVKMQILCRKATAEVTNEKDETASKNDEKVKSNENHKNGSKPSESLSSSSEQSNDHDTENSLPENEELYDKSNKKSTNNIKYNDDSTNDSNSNDEATNDSKSNDEATNGSKSNNDDATNDSKSTDEATNDSKFNDESTNDGTVNSVENNDENTSSTISNDGEHKDDESGNDVSSKENNLEITESSEVSQSMELDANCKGFSKYGTRPDVNFPSVYYYSNNVKICSHDFGNLTSSPRLILPDVKKICI